jgi:hypothetical protein
MEIRGCKGRAVRLHPAAECMVGGDLRACQQGIVSTPWL